MEKFVLRSRALWAMLLPGLAVIAQQTGLGDEVLGQAKAVVEGLLGAAGAAMWLWHHFRPDERTPVLRLPGAAAGAILLALVLSSYPLSGCALGLTKTDEAWSAHIVAGQAQISAGPACEDEDKTNCEGILVTGGPASEGFVAGILSPLGTVLKAVIGGL